MKTNRIQFYFLTLLLMSLFSSCSIQKRTFNQGYYFNWHFSSKTKLAEKQTSENESVVKESLASEKEFIKESSDLNEENFAENDLKNETDRHLDDQESVVAATERKHSSFLRLWICQDQLLRAR